jgi:hypothetical protein
MKPAAIIAVLALALTAPSTALARVYFGTVRYAAPHAAAAPGAARATSEAPYLAYVSVAYNSHGGTLVMKYAFYQPSLWNGRHMPNPPEVLLGPACPDAEGLEILAQPHELLFEVGQASSTEIGSSRPLGLAHIAGYTRQISGGSPLSFSGASYRVAVASSHLRARKWPCLTVAPAAQAGPGGPYSLELDEPVSTKMSAAGQVPASKVRLHEARVTRERREEREEERTAEHQEQHERREERKEQRVEERKERGAETKSEREQREALEKERRQERREEEEERREEEQERREEEQERCEEEAELHHRKPHCPIA